MEGLSVVTWRKSSFSGGNGGQCLEAGSLPSAVFVRDTANRDGVVLTLSAATWRAFVNTIK